jgi:hypothetical protein
MLDEIEDEIEPRPNHIDGINVTYMVHRSGSFTRMPVVTK